MKNRQTPYPCIVLLLAVVLCPFLLVAQKKKTPQVIVSNEIMPAGNINCGSDLILERLRSDPGYKLAEEKMNRDILAYSTSARIMAVDYTLPVVFHVISSNPSAVTDAQLIAALADLNDAFAKTGAYIGGDHPATPGVDTRIRFCLAQKDPDGGNTTGITRTESFFTDFDMDIEDSRMKNLVQWDPSRYINIWYVTDIKSEIMALFSCGVWTRLKAGGYATMPPGGGAADGIVVTGFGPLLAHEMGHYLGLYHTFEGMNCANANCTAQGDRVCDTPPDRLVTSSPSCTSPDNSCNSDSLSGFTTDIPDMISNFMDYGNDACHKSFTEGQAARMRAAIATQRNSLLLQNQCTKPCNENSVASFTRNNAYPLPGDVITFTNASTGAANFEWLVDNISVAATANLTYTFATTGKYKVTLKAYNTNTNCYAMYTDYVIVNCGVTARFYPDKRKIASKQNVLVDSIYFTNRSVNATSYSWLMSNDAGMAEQEVSTASDLKYFFLQPARYTVRLIATNGTCTDTTETFSFTVDDPTADAELHMNATDCYDQTKIRVSFYACNNGYVPIPAGTPLTFYDKDPRIGNANIIGTFSMPNSVPGKCCGFLYTHVLDISYSGLNTVYAVINDNGTTMPLNLPNTTFFEKNYTNNIASRSNFQFKVTVNPLTATLEPGDNLQLNANAGPSPGTYSWSPAYNLSCTDCYNPVHTAGKDTTFMVKATSTYGCVDSAFTVIKVPPADDYVIEITEVECSGTNQLYAAFTICNNFQRGVIPQGLKVSFYDADPATGNAKLLGPVFTTAQNYTDKCVSFGHSFNRTAPGKIYAVVNDNGTTIPLSLPNYPALPEKTYTNNKTVFEYVQQYVQLQPADTTVYRKETITGHVLTNVTDPASIKWQTANGYSLSCIDCAAPLITVTNNATIKMQMSNQRGCIIPGEMKVKIFPPDMTVEILETACYTNTNTLIKFRICSNNGYDTIANNLPVSFYETIANGSHKILSPVFTTTRTEPTGCAVFTHIINSPTVQTVFAVVNDKGKSVSSIPDPFITETNYSNNIQQKDIVPFSVTVTPADTSILRASTIQLHGQAAGGTVSFIQWEPSENLSCTDCLNPLATSQPSAQYKLTVQNEYLCTASAYAVVKTYTGRKINIPSAFTPNNDGLNDVFYIMAGKEVKRVVNLSVFNRWGEKVFESTNSPANDRSYGWNGIFKGKPAGSGTYVYLTTVEFTDGKEQFKGTITLIR